MSQAMRMLLAEGLVSKQQLDRATFTQATHGATIDYHLIASGALSSEQLVRFLVRRFPVVHWPRSRFEGLSQHVLETISPRLAVTLRMLPLSRSGNTVVLGLTDPSRHHAIQEAAHYSGAVIQPVVISHDDMNWALSRYYPSLAGDLAEDEVPVPLTQRVTREFESWNGTEPYAQAPPAPAEPAEMRADAIPLVNRTVAAETRPLRRSSDPGRKAWAASGVVKRDAVVVGSRTAGAAPPVKASGPAVVTSPVRQVVSTTPVRQAVSTTPVRQAVTTTPVRQAVSTTPVRQAVSTTPVRQAVTTTPVRQAVTTTPVRQAVTTTPVRQAVTTTPVRQAVSTTPVRQADEQSRELARQASRLIPDYDSWTPPPAERAPARATEPARRPAETPSSAPRRRASHPLSRPRASQSSPDVAAPRPEPRPAPQPEPSRRLSEGELIAAIDKAADRDRIVGLALEYLLRFARRAVFFVVKSNEIRGFDIAGEFTSRDAIRSFWIPTASPSTLRGVVTARRIHFDTLGTAPADAVLAAALGGRPERAMIVPVTIRDRVVGLLFADRLDIDTPPWNRLERLSQAVGDNLGRLIGRGSKS